MKVILFVCLFCFCNELASQTIEITYESRSFFAKNILSKADQLPLTKKMVLINKFDGLIKHYTLYSDGKQIVRSLDSLTQNCDVEEVSMYPYEQILITNNNDWDKYLRLDESSHSVIYKITEKRAKDVWKIDYSSTKNILGFKCFYSENESNHKEWAWFTLDVPITATPVSKFPFNGVVLEYQDESDIYVATDVQLNKEIKELDCFDENTDKTINLNNFREFSDILINNGMKMSTDMFQCRKL